MSASGIAVHRAAFLAAISVTLAMLPSAAQSATTPDTGRADSAARTGSTDARSSASSDNTTNGKSANAGAESGLLLIVPLAWSDQTVKKDGCWAKLYDGKNYSGDSFMLAGQQQLASMTGPFGLNWQNRIKSVETGTKATVTIFDNRDFRDRDKVIAPGSKVPDLSAKMGFLDDFRSMKLACSA